MLLNTKPVHPNEIHEAEYRNSMKQQSYDEDLMRSSLDGKWVKGVHGDPMIAKATPYQINEKNKQPFTSSPEYNKFIWD